MNIKKIIMVGMASVASLALGEVGVTGVTAKQRYPWNGLVDITVTLSGTEEEFRGVVVEAYRDAGQNVSDGSIAHGQSRLQFEGVRAEEPVRQKCCGKAVAGLLVKGAARSIRHFGMN